MSQNRSSAVMQQRKEAQDSLDDYRVEPTNASPFILAPGQEFYTSADFAPLGTLARIINLRLLQGGQNRYSLDERDVNYLNDIAVNAAWRGLPTDYSFDQAQMLRIYPIPDVAYPVGIVGTQRFVTLAQAADANVWTQDAFDLIKSEAKLILAREVLYDQEMEAAMMKAVYGDPNNSQERGYLKALKNETTRRTSQRARVRPTYF